MSYIIGKDDYGGDGSGSGGVSCEDCGNQAKKDCQHKRCRTCCRSRGLPCETHVNSTWVPAAKRRERRQQLSLSPQQQNISDNQQLSLMITSGAGVGVTEHNSNNRGGGGVISATHLHNSTTSSGSYFPAEVSFPANFRRVTLSGMDETNQQSAAYQTAVSIGGHVFNGILYDHGPDHQGTYDHPYFGGSNSSAAVAQHQDDVNLITSGTTDTATGNYPAVTVIDPSSTYPTPLSAFMAGTQFFPPPRS